MSENHSEKKRYFSPWLLGALAGAAVLAILCGQKPHARSAVLNATVTPDLSSDASVKP